MITEEQANIFAKHWIESWNNHDIDAILEHYDNSIEFVSPFIKSLNFNDKGKIENKAELKAYFEIGLKAFPDLKFELHNVFVGENSIVLHYTSVNNRKAAEVFELNAAGKVIRVLCNYFR